MPRISHIHGYEIYDREAHQNLTAFKDDVEKEFVSVRGEFPKDVRRYKTPYDFGARGDGVEDDTASFIALFASNEPIFVPTGKYRLTDRIQVYSNTTAIFSNSAEVVCDYTTNKLFSPFSFGVRNTDYATEYNGVHDVLFSGGRFILNYGEDGSADKGGGLFAIAHARNVRIENAFFGNELYGHYIELNSSTDCTISNCVFKGKGQDDIANCEAINIDAAFYLNFPTFGAYDGTTCRNITISDCVFDGVRTGIGTHAQHEQEHTNIKIVRCVSRNQSGRFIHMNCFNGLMVVDCEVKNNAGVQTMLIEGGKNLTIKNSVFADCAEGIQIMTGEYRAKSEHVFVSGCTFENINGANGGVYLRDVAHAQVHNNLFKNCATIAIAGQDCEYCIISDNVIDGGEHARGFFRCYSNFNNGRIVDNTVVNPGAECNYAVELGTAEGNEARVYHPRAKYAVSGDKTLNFVNGRKQVLNTAVTTTGTVDLLSSVKGFIHLVFAFGNSSEREYCDVWANSASSFAENEYLLCRTTDGTAKFRLTSLTTLEVIEIPKTLSMIHIIKEV